MLSRIKIIVMLPLLLLLQSALLHAQQSQSSTWNQFRGPDRSGTSEEVILSEQLPENGPELLWKKELGSGFSEIIIKGDRLITMFSHRIDELNGQEYIGAFETLSGNLIWKSEVDSLFFEQFGDGPRSTPILSDGVIYSLSSFGKLTANSFEDGKQLWQVNFLQELGSTMPRWGFSSSPVLVDDVLILETGGKDSGWFAGFDKNTGKLLWSKGIGAESYSSPIVAEINGTSQILFANRSTLISFNSKGDTLWTHAMSVIGPTASPVFFDSNKIFLSSVNSNGFCVLEVSENGVAEKLNSNTMKNDFSTSLYYEGHIYGFNVAALQCISAETGEKKWTKRGFGKGTLIRVGDKLLVLSDKGKLIQIKATPDVYEEQGAFQAVQGKCWTAPSFSDGNLFIRNLKEMACYKFN